MNEKAKIVKALLEKGRISMDEAVILLDGGGINVNIEKVVVEGKMVMGDDMENAKGEMNSFQKKF